MRFDDYLPERQIDCKSKSKNTKNCLKKACAKDI